MKISKKSNFLMWIFKKWSVLPHYSHFNISKNAHARLPKNVYQLNEVPGGISGLDSKHGTPTQMSEVFGLIPKYLNKMAGHLSHFSSEFHKILALTLEKFGTILHFQ